MKNIQPALMFCCLFLLVFLSEPSRITGGEWIPAGETQGAPLPRMTEVLASRHTATSSLAVYQHLLHMAWTEPDMLGVNQVYLKKLSSGGRWEFIGKSQNRDRTYFAGYPALAADENSLYIAWVEKNLQNISQLHVKKWNGNTWTPLGGDLNINPEREAKSPVLAVFKGSLYIAWLEAGEKEWNKLYIKHWNGSEWIADGEGFGLNPRHIILSPVMVFGEDEGHLAWSEAGDDGIFQIRYAVWKKEKWSVSPNSLNKSSASQAFNPAMVLFKGIPWLAFQEREPKAGGFSLQLRHLEGASWQNDNGLLPDGGIGKLDPALGTNNDHLFLAWEERIGKGVPEIFVRQILPGTNESRNASLNVSANSFGLNPAFLSGGSDLYLSWKENNAGDIYQNHVARYSEK